LKSKQSRPSQAEHPENPIDACCTDHQNIPGKGPPHPAFELEPLADTQPLLALTHRARRLHRHAGSLPLEKGGFNILFDALPTNGRVLLLPERERATADVG